MERLGAEEFLRQLAERRETFWDAMQPAGKSYGAEKPLSRTAILRRLQFGVVMEHRAAEVSARWVGEIAAVELRQALSEYVANELKHAAILRKRVAELEGDPDALWSNPLPELKELWEYHGALGSVCELIASVQYGHEEFFPRTSRSFIARIETVDPETASIYRDTLLPDEEAHAWLAPELLKRYAIEGAVQQRCFDALQKGCELFARAIRSFNREVMGGRT